MPTQQVELTSSLPPQCSEPREALSGYDTGYVSCNRSQWFHRSERLECPSLLPRTRQFALSDGGVCEDARCTESAHGYCQERPASTEILCAYGCVRDDECKSGEVCFCGDPIGTCVKATCTSDFAAFARFVLELLGAGAPAQLVAAAQRALGDEIEHARGGFALASAYAGKPVGPGSLGSEGVLADTGLAASVSAAIHEACVGETLAAVEAREALAGATDPAVRALLERIVEDESAHAELGWRFLRWALTGAERPLRDLARREFEFATRRELAGAEAALRTAETPSAQLQQHGLCPSQRRAAAQRAALLELVLPVGNALLAAAAEGAPGTQPTAYAAAGDC